MKNEKTQIIQSIIITSIISLIFIFLGITYVKIIKNHQEVETEHYLYEVAQQSKDVIKKQIEGDLQTMQAMATLIGESEDVDIGKLLEALRKENNQNPFMRMGFIDLNGISYMVDMDNTIHKGIDLSDREYVKSALNGEQYLSETIKDKLSGEYINCYSVPVFHNGKVRGALFAVLKNELFQDIISISSFGGQGFSHVIKKDGGLVVHSRNENSIKNLNNIFDVDFINENIVYEVKDNIEKGYGGMFLYLSSNIEKLATYIPIGINDWYIVSVVPKTAINRNFDKIIKMSIFTVIIAILIFILLVMYIDKVKKKSRENILKLAYYDELTGAYNKNKFIFEAKRLLHQKSSNYAMVVLDINNFKFINELFGYFSGDILLKHLVKTLNIHLQNSEICFRDSADKFGILMNFKNENLLKDRLNLIMKQISDFTFENNQKYFIVVNCGINIINAENHDLDFSLLIDHAFSALIKAKGIHTNNYAFYDKELHKNTIQKNMIENTMQSALENNEFVVYLQPKYDLNTEKIVGAEALVRWKKSETEFIFPDLFIPIFEKNGFITKLDMYVLDRVCQILTDWKDKGYEIFPISVNQSRMHLYNDNYLKQIKQIVDEKNISANMIILEVTESVVLENHNNLKNVIDTLHEIGFTISMDDFGSGYSSLNILKDMPIDELKLDKIFLDKTTDPLRGEKIITKIVELAKCLYIKTVTEGVETKEQAEFLRDIDCDIAQGYYFARPMPTYDFEKLAFGDTNQQPNAAAQSTDCKA